MKCLYVSRAIGDLWEDSGGFDIVCQIELEALAEICDEVVAVTTCHPYHQDETFKDEKENITIYYGPVRRGYSSEFFSFVQRMHDDYNPDFVFSQSYGAHLLPTNKPTVFRSHATPILIFTEQIMTSRFKPVKFQLARSPLQTPWWDLNRYSGVIATTQLELDLFLHLGLLPKERSIYALPTSDTAGIKPLEERSDFVLLSAAKITYAPKGIRDFLPALASNFSSILVSYKASSHKIDMDFPNVRFVHSPSRLAYLQLLRQARVYVDTTISPAHCNLTTFEALALGVPVVRWRVGIASEVIEDRINGVLVEPFSVEDLIDAIKFAETLNPEPVNVASKEVFQERVKELLSSVL